MIIILFFVLCSMTSITSYRVGGMQWSLKDDFKPTINIKSVHMKSGYIVDCIDINKQSAFEHPLLDNHMLKKSPSFRIPFWGKEVKNSSTHYVFGTKKNLCPNGYVPIRRTTKDDLIRANSLLNSHILSKGMPGRHVAEVSVQAFSGPYYGVSGIHNVYDLKVYNYQTTSSYLWVQNGGDKIVAGWHINPHLYGEDGPHLFSFWKSAKKPGCYNVQCPGFVQIDRGIHLGARIRQGSIYGGTQLESPVALLQDPSTKNWWLNVQGHDVGYFPAILFSNMATGAAQVGWGGATTTSVGSPSPPMGSGYFPDDNFVHACYFRHVSFHNKTGDAYGPETSLVQISADNPNCYRAEYYGDQSGEVGYSLQFGGPGGECGD